MILMMNLKISYASVSKMNLQKDQAGMKSNNMHFSLKSIGMYFSIKA